MLRKSCSLHEVSSAGSRFFLHQKKGVTGSCQRHKAILHVRMITGSTVPLELPARIAHICLPPEIVSSTGEGLYTAGKPRTLLLHANSLRDLGEVYEVFGFFVLCLHLGQLHTTRVLVIMGLNFIPIP